jgi:hypothetical protein
MRSTRAVAAVERLKTRSADSSYAMVSMSTGLFYLARRAAAGDAGLTRISEPMPLDAFVEWVNRIEPEKPRKASKLDIKFEQQLTKKPAPDR